ncbi:MAG: glutamyl-tRNA reductase [Verrucomicrobiae bacterium]|nr:glutamyl-tRNA reductase [Verrucomicrobiae bacterium]
MKFICLGLNHQTASVEIRERLARQVGVLREKGGIWPETVVLSTCNRVEIYAMVPGSQHTPEAILGQLSADHDPGDMRGGLYLHEGPQALSHLFRVAAGMDSMVVGETEIFGQVKKAYEEAAHRGMTGKYLNRIFQKAFQVGKEIRSQTRIGQGNASLSAVAVALAEKIFGTLAGRRVMLLGAGEIGESTARAFLARGLRSLCVINRSEERARALAGELGGQWAGLGDLARRAVESDIIVSSTSSEHYLITPKTIEKVMEQRGYQPLFLIDLAVPRDVDPGVNWIDSCYLYNVDDLQAMADEANVARVRELEKCEEIVAAKVARVQAWVDEKLA